jgi:predicted O-methyltransferase YrrM
VRNSRHRRLIHQVATHFGYREGDAPRLPTVPIDKVTSASTPVVLTEPIAQDGNVTLLELLVLTRVARERLPKRIFEIGTFDGRTTLALASNASDDAVVETLDLPPNTPTQLALERADLSYVEKPRSGDRFRGTEVARKIKQLYGDSATFDFGSHSADYVFVDGSHAYEYVLNDSERALALLRGGPGVILWHDYGEWRGVTAGLEHLAATDKRFANLAWIEGTTLVILDQRS